MGEAWLALGRRDRAEEYFRALEAAAATAPAGGFHRAWYLALLNHHRMVPDVLSRVARDLVVRPDVHGWDLLAWALQQQGRREEARAAIGIALATGTDDPDILRHARIIGEAP